MRLHTPSYFGDFGAVLAFRDRLEAEMLAGRMTRARYWRRLKMLCAAYKRECQMRDYTPRAAEDREGTDGR